MTLLAPQTREGSFSTDIFKRHQRSEQAFVLALMEMVVKGVSTRKVSQITEERVLWREMTKGDSDSYRQFSTCNPLTRLNSLTLEVTRIKPRATPVPAMSAS